MLEVAGMAIMPGRSSGSCPSLSRIFILVRAISSEETSGLAKPGRDAPPGGEPIRAEPRSGEKGAMSIEGAGKVESWVRAGNAVGEKRYYL